METAGELGAGTQRVTVQLFIFLFLGVVWGRDFSTYAELMALVVSVALWDIHWKDSYVLWKTDCKAHIYGLYKIRTKAPELLPLHDFIDTRQAWGSYRYLTEHIAGVDNTIADALSRGCLEDIPSTWIRCRPDIDLLPSSFGTKLEL